MIEPVITVVRQGDSAKPTVDFTVGLPACGKSTWARAEQYEDLTIVRVNNDDLGRAMSKGRTKQNGALLAAVRETVLRKGIEQGRRVIVDNTNLSPRAQQEILRAAEADNRTVRRVDFTAVSKDECIRRDALRQGNECVGRTVIEKMHDEFLAQPSETAEGDFRVRAVGEFMARELSGRVFLTSDLHFGHQNILGFGRDQAFADLEAMHEGIIRQWNANVRPDDTVFVLGDVAMGKRTETLPLIGRCNGIKHLIAGNHDNCWEHGKNPAKWRDTYLEYFATIQTEAFLETSCGRVRLHHFPYSGDHTEEDRYPYARPIDDGLPLLHGHVHDLWRVCESAEGTPQVNVGVDVWGFKPVSLVDAIIGFWEAKPPNVM